MGAVIRIACLLLIVFPVWVQAQSRITPSLDSVSALFTDTLCLDIANQDVCLSRESANIGRFEDGDSLWFGLSADADITTLFSDPILHVESDAADHFLFTQTGANANGATLAGFKTRAVTTAATTVVSADDDLLRLIGYTSDGAGVFSPAAQILFEADAASGSGDTPGRITFSTTADGAASLSTALRIDSSQRVLVGHTASVAGAGDPSLQVLGTGTGDSRLQLGRWSADGGGPGIAFMKSRDPVIADGTFAIVVDDDELLTIRGFVDDGVDFATEVWRWLVEVDDATPALGDVGVATVLSHRPGGGGGLTEVTRWDASGDMTFGNAAGPAILNVGSSTTVPTVAPDKSAPTTGVGGSGNLLSLIALSSEMVRFNGTTSGTVLEAMAVRAPNFTLSDGATARYRQISGGTVTTTLAGQTTVTTPNQGMAFDFAAIIYTESGGAVTVDAASTLHIPVVTAGGSVTITQNDMISTGVANTRLDSLGAWYVADGSVGAPSYGFGGNPDLGFFRIGDEIYVTINTNNRIRFTNDGVIGNSNDSAALLNESSSSTNPTLVVDRSEFGTGWGGTANNLSGIVLSTERILFNSSTTTDDLASAVLSAPAVTITSDATSSGQAFDVAAKTYNVDGGVNITTPMDGLGVRINAPVVASDSAVVISQLSTLYVAAPDVSDAEVTATSNLAAELDGNVLVTGSVGLGTATPLDLLHLLGADPAIYIEASDTNDASIILEDTDESGCTEITALNGVLTVATVTCPS